MTETDFRDRRMDAATLPALVADDLVEPELRHQLSTIMERNVWRYGWRPDGKGFGTAYLCAEFAGSNLSNSGDCTAQLERHPRFAPILALWRRMATTIAKGHTPIRVYALGHAFGGGGGVHRDNDEDPTLHSFVYYAHRQWDRDWGGETVFFDPSGRDIVQAVQPVPGRITYFLGDVEHAARPPARECPVLRSVYVFKTRLD
jgi:SM-20-related protein